MNEIEKKALHFCLRMIQVIINERINEGNRLLKMDIACNEEIDKYVKSKLNYWLDKESEIELYLDEIKKEMSK